MLIVLVLNLIAAAMVLEFERGNPDANIASYPDALWWAVTTITTVGYGDRFPMSSPGRAVAAGLMIAGIAMFGVITATIAAYFVEQQAGEDVASRLDQIMERLDRIEVGLRPGETSTPLSTCAADPWSLPHAWESPCRGTARSGCHSPALFGGGQPRAAIRRARCAAGAPTGPLPWAVDLAGHLVHAAQGRRVWSTAWRGTRVPTHRLLQAVARPGVWVELRPRRHRHLWVLRR